MEILTTWNVWRKTLSRRKTMCIICKHMKTCREQTIFIPFVSMCVPHSFGLCVYQVDAQKMFPFVHGGSNWVLVVIFFSSNSEQEPQFHYKKTFWFHKSFTEKLLCCVLFFWSTKQVANINCTSPSVFWPTLFSKTRLVLCRLKPCFHVWFERRPFFSSQHLALTSGLKLGQKTQETVARSRQTHSLQESWTQSAVTDTLRGFLASDCPLKTL